jgi:hypothetical protein
VRHIDDTPGVPCINDDDEAWNSVSLRGCQTSNETPSSETPLWYLVARYTMIPASIYEGFTGSILWVAQGTYLTFAAKSHAAVCNITEATAIGNFNGQFWSVFASNQVLYVQD